jgi:hypothetical protein
MWKLLQFQSARPSRTLGIEQADVRDYHERAAKQRQMLKLSLPCLTGKTPMKSADEMGATSEPAKPRSATTAASDDVFRDYDAFRAFHRTLEDFQTTDDQHKPVADHYLDHNGTSERKAIYDRLLSIGNEMKRRGPRASRWFARYLMAICIGVAATLAWQSYGGIAKHAPTAPAAPTVDPQVHQIALDVAAVRQSVEQQRAAVRQNDPEQLHQIALDVAAVRQSVEQQLAAGRQIDPEQVHQIALNVAAVRQSVEQQLAALHQSVEQQIAAVRQTVEQIAASQDQMTHRIDTLQTSQREILEKIPAPLPPRLIAAPAHKPTPATPPLSRAPPPPYLRPYP